MPSRRRPILDGLRARRDALQAEGRIAGLGVAFYLDPSAAGWEYARVTLNADGTAHIVTGATQQGHGRWTAFSQIASDALGLPMAAITLDAGDTGTAPVGIGAVGSRATAIGGSAVMEACARVKAMVADGAPLPVTAESRYEVAGQAWAFGAYAALVEIDAETGVARVLRAHAHDDTGVIVNPVQVEGQIRGGFAQALGETMLEAIALDADGQLLTGSFMDYAMPRADDLPPLSLSQTQTPSPMNPLGAKGVGEAATTGAPAALINAVTDAFRPTGKAPPQMPFFARADLAGLAGLSPAASVRGFGGVRCGFGVATAATVAFLAHISGDLCRPLADDRDEFDLAERPDDHRQEQRSRRPRCRGRPPCRRRAGTATRAAPTGRARNILCSRRNLSSWCRARTSASSVSGALSSGGADRRSRAIGRRDVVEHRLEGAAQRREAAVALAHLDGAQHGEEILAPLPLRVVGDPGLRIVHMQARADEAGLARDEIGIGGLQLVHQIVALAGRGLEGGDDGLGAGVGADRWHGLVLHARQPIKPGAVVPPDQASQPRIAW